MTEKVTYARLKWAGGTHRFCIDLSQPVSLYPIPDPFARLQRLMMGQWSAQDVYDTIRRGLATGTFSGNAMGEAQALFDRFCHRRPIADLVPLAQTVLGVAIFGIDKAVADLGLEPEEVDARPDGDADVK